MRNLINQYINYYIDLGNTKNNEDIWIFILEIFVVLYIYKQINYNQFYSLVIC